MINMEARIIHPHLTPVAERYLDQSLPQSWHGTDAVADQLPKTKQVKIIRSFQDQDNGKLLRNLADVLARNAKSSGLARSMGGHSSFDVFIRQPSSIVDSTYTSHRVVGRHGRVEGHMDKDGSLLPTGAAQMPGDEGPH